MEILRMTSRSYTQSASESEVQTAFSSAALIRVSRQSMRRRKQLSGRSSTCCGKGCGLSGSCLTLPCWFEWFFGKSVKDLFGGSNFFVCPRQKQHLIEFLLHMIICVLYQSHKSVAIPSEKEYFAQTKKQPVTSTTYGATTKPVKPQPAWLTGFFTTHLLRKKSYIPFQIIMQAASRILKHYDWREIAMFGFC